MSEQCLRTVREKYPFHNPPPNAPEHVKDNESAELIRKAGAAEEKGLVVLEKIAAKL